MMVNSDITRPYIGMIHVPERSDKGAWVSICSISANWFLKWGQPGTDINDDPMRDFPESDAMDSWHGSNAVAWSMLRTKVKVTVISAKNFNM